jgi:hypothetical protein
MYRHKRLNILQYNVRTSRDMVMASLLRDPVIYDFDIIAIQESWRDPYTATTHHPVKDRFHLCYPTGEAEGLALVCFSSTREWIRQRGASRSGQETSGCM